MGAAAAPLTLAEQRSLWAHGFHGMVEGVSNLTVIVLDTVLDTPYGSQYQT